jgi:hypothetical protein
MPRGGVAVWAIGGPTTHLIRAVRPATFAKCIARLRTPMSAVSPTVNSPRKKITARPGWECGRLWLRGGCRGHCRASVGSVEQALGGKAERLPPLCRQETGRDVAGAHCGRARRGVVGIVRGRRLYDDGGRGSAEQQQCRRARRAHPDALCGGDAAPWNWPSKIGLKGIREFHQSWE